MKLIKYELSDTDSWFIQFSVLGIFLGFINLGYYTTLVFTNDKIRPSHVECYTTDVYMGLGTFWYDQYLFEWWLAIINWLCFIYPLLQLSFWAYTTATMTSIRIPSMILSAVIFVVFLLSLAIILYETIFCADFNFCRSCDCEQKFSCTPNPGFIWRSLYQGYFLSMILTYGFVAFMDLNEKSAEDRVKGWMLNYQMAKYLIKMKGKEM
jgi:hypothetical protein